MALCVRVWTAGHTIYGMLIVLSFLRGFLGRLHEFQFWVVGEVRRNRTNYVKQRRY